LYIEFIASNNRKTVQLIFSPKAKGREHDATDTLHRFLGAVDYPFLNLGDFLRHDHASKSLYILLYGRSKGS
jgi:hypothetical protein